MENLINTHKQEIKNYRTRINELTNESYDIQAEYELKRKIYHNLIFLFLTLTDLPFLVDTTQ